MRRAGRSKRCWEMPELPEVETTRRLIAPVITDRTIRTVHVSGARTLRRQERPADFAGRLEHHVVQRVTRHGKYIVIGVENDLAWIVHLGMSGRLTLAEPSDPVEPHTRFVVGFDAGPQLRFIDPRTFGFTAVLTPEERAVSSLARLGPDALDDLPRSRDLATRLSGRSAPIKAILLDQNVIAGVGNIYADESLHRARIAPQRPAGSLGSDELKHLRSGIRMTLSAALDAGGTTLGDLAYLLPDRRAGGYLPRLRVYGREGEPCRRCGTSIRRSTIRARSTFWCPDCQR